jgi:uncharacterized protein
VPLTPSLSTSRQSYTAVPRPPAPPARCPPPSQEVSAPDNYGCLNLITSDEGAGIPGGVGGGTSYESHAVFYVGVQDVEAALQRAVELGGTRVMGLATSPNGFVVGHFTDFEGALIGVAGVA